MEKISFCVTYYNQSEFVEQSLSSILSLDMPCDFEILIGDDGSTDETINKVKDFQRRYPDKIKLFVMPRKSDVVYNHIHRASDNRLNLVKNAVGDYIMFLDGDDFYCDKNFVCQAFEIFKKDKNVFACAFNFEYFYPENNSTKIHQQNLQTGKLDIKGYIHKGYIPCGSFIFRNIFDIDKIALCAKSKNFDDNLITIYMLYICAINNQIVYYINKPIYAYRQTQHSLWNAMSEYEQHLVNAMDYEIISRVAPNFKQLLARRQGGAINAIFKNRSKLLKLLGKEKFEKYIKENKDLGNDFILSLLIFNKLSFVEKLKAIMKYKKIKKYMDKANNEIAIKYKKYKRLYKIFLAISIIYTIVFLALIFLG